MARDAKEARCFPLWKPIYWFSILLCLTWFCFLSPRYQEPHPNPKAFVFKELTASECERGWWYSSGLRAHTLESAWVLILALSLPGCVALSRFLNFSASQFTHLKNGDSNSTYLAGLLWALNLVIHIKQLAKHLAHSKASVLSFIVMPTYYVVMPIYYVAGPGPTG